MDCTNKDDVKQRIANLNHKARIVADGLHEHILRMEKNKNDAELFIKLKKIAHQEIAKLAKYGDEIKFYEKYLKGMK